MHSEGLMQKDVAVPAVEEEGAVAATGAVGKLKAAYEARAVAADGGLPSQQPHADEERPAEKLPALEEQAEDGAERQEAASAEAEEAPSTQQAIFVSLYS